MYYVFSDALQMLMEAMHNYCCCLKYCNLIELFICIMCFLLHCNLISDIHNYCFCFIVLIPDKNYVILMKIILETVPKYLVEFFKSKWKDAFHNAALDDGVSGGMKVLTALMQCYNRSRVVTEVIYQMPHGNKQWNTLERLLLLLFASPELLEHHMENYCTKLWENAMSKNDSSMNHAKVQELKQMITNGHLKSWDPSVMFLLLLFGPLGLIDNRRPHYEREPPFRESENIYRLWVIRNKIFEHRSNMTVSDEEFNSFVNDIKEISENTLDGKAKDEINTIIRCQEPPLLSCELERKLWKEVEFSQKVLNLSSFLAEEFVRMYSYSLLLFHC